MPAQQIFIHAIKFLKDHYLNILNAKFTFRSKEIQWVLTIPPVWNDSAKHFMREACYKISMITTDLKLQCLQIIINIFITWRCVRQS